MKIALTQLLGELSKIEMEFVGEFADPDVMYDAIFNSFIMPASGYELPNNYGMFSKKGNERIKDALIHFLADPETIAAARDLKTPQERLDAFQEPLKTSIGYAQEDFFGHRQTDERFHK